MPSAWDVAGEAFCEPDADSLVSPWTPAAAEDEDGPGRSESVVGGVSWDSIAGVDGVVAEGEAEVSGASLGVVVDDASVVNDSATA